MTRLQTTILVLHASLRGRLALVLTTLMLYFVGMELLVLVVSSTLLGTTLLLLWTLGLAAAYTWLTTPAQLQ